MIVDSQSVKNTDSAEEKGYDAGKHISGIKRHIGVDISGLPQAIGITRANVTDRDGACMIIQNSKRILSEVKKLLFDGGYSGEKFSNKVKEILGEKILVEVVKRNELHTFKVLPKRWIVERCFGWLEKFRRLWKNCERKLSTSRQMVILAFLIILLKRL